MRILGLRFSAGVAATLALAVGCASKHEPTLAELKAAELPYLNAMVAEQHRIQERVIARCQRKYEQAKAAGTEPVLDVLVLSGGGAKGAFGAGFLVGWGEVTEPALTRPQFDVVSGVSTGSLIAPLAFLGDDESYRLANETYRNPSDDWVKPRGLLDVLITKRSLYTDEGLFQSICKTIGTRVDRLAAEARQDRTLIVAAVNLNQGLTRVWDLSADAIEVSEGRMTQESFCRRLLSSASIPLVFPPQLIENNLYVDGSTTSDILMTLDAFRERHAFRDLWNQKHPGEKFPRLRLWVIANTTLFDQPVPVDTGDVSVLGRSLTLAIQAGLISDLKILELFQDLLKREGFDVEFRFVAMPNGYVEKEGSSMFDKDAMDAMSDLGMKMGRDPNVWQQHVPNLLMPLELRDELMREAAVAKPQ